MPVIAVVNRKGGSGKTTLATHLAAYCSRSGWSVMLGDADSQRSAHVWLRQRQSQLGLEAAQITGWKLNARNIVRPPAGAAHVVLDTPGGLQGFDLARLVMYADAILIPVCNSVFDRESAKDCYRELAAMPRIASGKCKVAAIGMRLDARTKSGEVLRAWAGELQLPFLSVIREAQLYVRCAEKGLSIFDLPTTQVESDLAQWQPILDWAVPIFNAKPRTLAELASPATLRAERQALFAGGAAQVRHAAVSGKPTAPVHASTASRIERWLDALSLGKLLHKR